METFKTEVHVPPGSSIEFELHYQEMMSRKLGIYEHMLHLQPGRLVPNFQVSVSPPRSPADAPGDLWRSLTCPVLRWTSTSLSPTVFPGSGRSTSSDTSSTTSSA